MTKKEIEEAAWSVLSEGEEITEDCVDWVNGCLREEFIDDPTDEYISELVEEFIDNN